MTTITTTYIDAITEALSEEMARDPSIVLLGEDVGKMGGVFKTTAGLQDEYGVERVIDSPLAEASIIGVAIGMSLNGLRPVAEIQFADFIHSALDQIISEAARMRYRSNGGWHCPMVIRVPYGAGVHGGLYHSQSIEATLSHIPGLKIVAPSNPKDAKGLLKAAIRDNDPVVFLEHKKAYRLIKGEMDNEDYTVPIGKANTVRVGDDVTVITYGLMVQYAIDAANMLADKGTETEILDLRTLSPLDDETIIEAAKKTGKVLIVHEDNRNVGLGAEIAARIADKAFEYLDAPVSRLTAPDVPAMPYAPELEDFCLPNRNNIEEAIRELAAY